MTTIRYRNATDATLPARPEHNPIFSQPWEPGAVLEMPIELGRPAPPLPLFQGDVAYARPSVVEKVYGKGRVVPADDESQAAYDAAIRESSDPLMEADYCIVRARELRAKAERARKTMRVYAVRNVPAEIAIHLGQSGAVKAGTVVDVDPYLVLPSRRMNGSKGPSYADKLLPNAFEAADDHGRAMMATEYAQDYGEACARACEDLATELEQDFRTWRESPAGRGATQPRPDPEVAAKLADAGYVAVCEERNRLDRERFQAEAREKMRAQIRAEMIEKLTDEEMARRGFAA